MLRYGPSLSGKWVLWAHDIFGPDSGRTKEYCEKISQELGLTCILPGMDMITGRLMITLIKISSAASPGRSSCPYYPAGRAG